MFFFKTSANANYEKKIYDFSIESITGEIINLKDYKNKVILVVNTASYCGFTKQYDELQQIIVNFSQLIKLTLDHEASYFLAKISRGTPRIALRFLRRVRDYAQVVERTNIISENLIKKALNSYKIDDKGLDFLDRQYLSFLNQNNNIPIGLDSIAAGLGDDSSMLEFVVEPYLIQIGFLTRTPRGRLLTSLGKKYIDSENDNF